MIISGSLSKLVGALLVACTLLSSNVFATALWKRDPAAGYSGWQADSNTPLYIEDVFLGGSGHLEKITWWGYDLGGASGPVNDFQVMFNGTVQSGVITETLLDIDLTLYEMLLASPVSFVEGAATLSVVNNSLDVEWYWKDSVMDPAFQALRLDGVLLAQSVPEPDMLALFGLAGAGLFFSLRRSRKYV